MKETVTLSCFEANVSDQDRIRRQQLLCEAEGYLDLVTVLADKWPPSTPVRDRLCQRVLDVLAMLEPVGEGQSRMFYLKGQALLTMERWAEAIEPFEIAAEYDTDNIHIWLALGWCRKRVGRLDLAIQSLEEALAIEPDEAIIHYTLACYWSLAKNPKLAIHYLASAFDIDTNYRDMVGDETDFDNIRNHPDFLALTTVIV